MSKTYHKSYVCQGDNSVIFYCLGLNEWHNYSFELLLCVMFFFMLCSFVAGFCLADEKKSGYAIGITIALTLLTMETMFEFLTK